MKYTVIVIDGMGGGIGAQLIGKLREVGAPENVSEKAKTVEIVALGTNSSATERMMKAGAHRGATGENAIKVSAGEGDFILGPIGIVIPNSLMGEITPIMAESVLASSAEKILIPLQNNHFQLVGLEPLQLGKLIEKAVECVAERIR